MYDDHVYSFSQLSSFDECPYGFYLERIEKEEQSSNFFAEQGSLIHSLLEDWANKKLTKEQLPNEYDLRYPLEVITAPPRMLAAKGYTQKAYELGKSYFENFDEFEGYEVLSAEEKFKINLELSDGTTRQFVGIIDMMLRDKKTDELIICDHKSKSWSAFKKAEDKMYMQQLLYATYVRQKYNKWPDVMMFNLFKENGDKATRQFTIDAYNKAINWATECIHKIESYEVLDWLECKEQDFFCTEICSVRKHCSNGIAIKSQKKGAKK